MTYRELPPPRALSSHVACVWTREAAPDRIVPDGCADLVWTGADLIVAGPATRATMPSLPGGRKLGIRFRVGAAGEALGLPAAELLDASPPIAEVWADDAELAERVGAAGGDADRLRLMADAVRARVRAAGPPDPMVRALARRLGSRRAPVAELADELGVSERQLRRRFAHAVGYPPRTLARVLRLQRFLAAAERGGELALLAAESGYADQAHLTRDCASLAGLPAGALIAAGVGPAGERLSRA